MKKFFLALLIFGCLASVFYILEHGFLLEINSTAFSVNYKYNLERSSNLQKQIAKIALLQKNILLMDRDIKDYFISIDTKYLIKYRKKRKEFQGLITDLLSQNEQDLTHEERSYLDKISQSFNLYNLNYFKILKMVRDKKKGQAMILSRTEHNELVFSILNNLDNFQETLNSKLQSLNSDNIEKTDKWLKQLDILISNQIRKSKKQVYYIIGILLGTLSLIFVFSFVISIFSSTAGKKEMFSSKRRVIIKNSGRYPTLPLESYKNIGDSAPFQNPEEIGYGRY